MADWERETAGAVRRLPAALLVLALLAGLAALALPARQGPAPAGPEAPEGDGGLVVEPDAPPGADPARPRGSWVAVPTPATLAEPRLAWTGGQAVVLGEDADGVVRGLAYAPASGEHREVAPAPLPAWREPHLVAAGGLLVAVALDERPGAVTVAVHDPQAGTWRRARAAPLGRWDRLVVESDGSEALLVGERLAEGAATREVSALRYDPRLDRWQALPSPGPAVRRVHDVAALDGLLVAVVGLADDHAPSALAAIAVPLGSSARSPRGGQVGWSRPDRAPVLGRWAPAALARPGHGDVVVAGPARSGTARLAGAAWVPWQGWQPLGVGEGAPPIGPPVLLGTDGGVLAWWADAPLRVHASGRAGWWSLPPSALAGRSGVAAADAEGRPLLYDEADGRGALWLAEGLAP